MLESMMTVREVAELLGISADTVYRLKGKPDGIPAYKVGGRLRFQRAEVEAYVAGQAVKADKVPFREKKDRLNYRPGMKVVS